MATVAYLIDDARDYSRFVYLMTMAFSFCWMQLSHMIYRWYVLKYRPYNAMTRKNADYHNVRTSKRGST